MEEGTAAAPTSDELSTEQLATANAVLDKWHARIASRGHMFHRHADGDLANAAPSNVTAIHPYVAFSSLYKGEEVCDDWVVYASPLRLEPTTSRWSSPGIPILAPALHLWIAHPALVPAGNLPHRSELSEEEIQFVKEHVADFCATYQESFAAAEVAKRGDDDAEVVSLTQQGDAAMEAGDAAKASELYELAMERRELVRKQRAEARDVFGATGTKTSPKQHGRRSAHGGGVVLRKERPSIISSEPSQRMKGKRAEVEARIAARK